VAAAAIALPALVPARVLSAPGRPGANERVHLGVIGTGIRGRYLIGDLPADGRVVAICDCYRPRMVQTLKRVPSVPEARLRQSVPASDAASWAMFQDYRRMIDEAKLDAVIIATPDHHHVLAAMRACQAGLDVYVEKPLSLTIAEGRRLVQMVRRYGRVCQVGSQQRSMELNRFACQFVRDGGLGKVTHVQVGNFTGPMRYAGLGEEPIPDGLDWDLFSGPAPLRPHNWRLWIKDERQVDGQNWRGWDVWRDYSGHLMTNWGGHSVDQVQWALGMDNSGPVELWPLTGGHRGDIRACPIVARYANGVELRFELTYLRGGGCIVHGERGQMIISRNHFSTVPPDLVKNPPAAEAAKIWQGVSVVAKPHLQDWLDCIKTRGTPHAPVEIAHRSVTVCHLAGIARELRRKIRWDPQQESFLTGDDEARALLDRPRRQGFALPTLS
jgi:predicted dehydrogenase